MSYARHALMVEPARMRPALWRLILGIATVVALGFLWAAGLFSVLGLVLEADQARALFDGLNARQVGPGGTILALALIAGIFPATLIAAAVWHGRRPGTLFGPRARGLRHFTAAAGLTFAVMVALLLLSLPFTAPPRPNMDPGLWLTWLPLALTALLFQTGAEELLFRGYLQSQLAARFRSPALWLILPSIGFALLHLGPGLSPVFLAFMALGTFTFGLMAADLTARTGSLGAAWGFHFANNVLALLVLSSDSTLAGLSLYLAAEPVNEMTQFTPLLLADLLIITSVWLVLRRVLTE
ncbi:MAG: CPBP family intramembrane metalloprotease [Silicimonas sp.]|nr:CPBP family intramembrane metalloprotease [Silicimonas sp.]